MGAEISTSEHSYKRCGGLNTRSEADWCGWGNSSLVAGRTRRAGKVTAKQADTCLGCNKKFKKTETSIQCTVCGLWCHKDCAAISNEYLKRLEEHKKNTGLAYWACRPCIVYAQGMNHRLKEIEKRIAIVEENAKKTADNVGQLEQRVEKISNKQDKMDKKIEQCENRCSRN